MSGPVLLKVGQPLADALVKGGKLLLELLLLVPGPLLPAAEPWNYDSEDGVQGNGHDDEGLQDEQGDPDAVEDLVLVSGEGGVDVDGDTHRDSLRHLEGGPSLRFFFHLPLGPVMTIS